MIKGFDYITIGQALWFWYIFEIRRFLSIKCNEISMHCYETILQLFLIHKDFKFCKLNAKIKLF